MNAAGRSSRGRGSLVESRLWQAVERFEEAWQRGERPSLDDYLPADEAGREALLPHLVHIDLERGLKAGEPVRVESYLQCYPALNDAAVLVDLLAELRAYPPPAGDGQEARTSRGYAGVAVPFELRTEAGVLAFISTTTVFGTPVDITLSELALETFFPADEATARVMNGKWENGNGKTERVNGRG